MDSAVRHLNKLIALTEKSIRLQKITWRCLVVSAAILFLIAAAVLILFLVGEIGEKASNMLLQFAPPSGGGIVTTAMSFFPYKAISPLELKTARYQFLKEDYLEAAHLPDPVREERRNRIREILMMEGAQF